MPTHFYSMTKSVTKSATLMKNMVLQTLDLSVVGLSKELAYSVGRNGKGDSSSHFQSVYTYNISVLFKWREWRDN